MKTRVRALPRKGTRGVRPHFRSLGADTKRAIFLPPQSIDRVHPRLRVRLPE